MSKPIRFFIVRQKLWNDDEYEAIISQMEKDGWEIDEQP